MSSVVVDTDVISFLFKDHPIASRYDVDLASRTLVISFMTLAELDRWAIHALELLGKKTGLHAQDL